MKNKTTGKYEVYKYFKRTGHHFIGIGDTKEEARADLKRQLSQFAVKTDTGRTVYQLPLEPTGETIRSPGCMWYLNENGGKHWILNPNREIAIMAAPHVAKAKSQGV